MAESDVIVGFRAYIDQIQDLITGKEVVSMELGQELERAAAAVDYAYSGKIVAVVSSGDAGIYGMSGPVFRVLTDRDWDGQSPAVVTVPGVSAMQAAAAVLGSPLMQDFCAISLSDLLTPWEKIRGRLEAAGQGDFVVALYNPRSKRRQTQLLEAREILLKHRPGDTPVGLVGDAFRPGQRVKLTTLQDLEKDADFVDMVTIVVIGNSTTYLHSGMVITPRGYEEKTRSA
jgi:precorrin-3B C17-methyltransferase